MEVSVEYCKINCVGNNNDPIGGDAERGPAGANRQQGNQRNGFQAFQGSGVALS